MAMRIIRLLPAILLILGATSFVRAANGPARFDGRRARAQSSGLGSVSFPISCAPAVQSTFNQGVALLHSFQYQEAEQTFTQVAQQDPTCAMAYWG
ncbi:MAG TPA: hypothetical protein VGR84_12590, partial [Candidatus Acidoferrales bacterium]|nr:hypothetical protein [Candidatus Acidoferrales bacterium]